MFKGPIFIVSNIRRVKVVVSRVPKSRRTMELYLCAVWFLSWLRWWMSCFLGWILNDQFIYSNPGWEIKQSDLLIKKAMQVKEGIVLLASCKTNIQHDCNPPYPCCKNRGSHSVVSLFPHHKLTCSHFVLLKQLSCEIHVTVHNYFLRTENTFPPPPPPTLSGE